MRQPRAAELLQLVFCRFCPGFHHSCAPRD